jgi:hypothetical protein
MLRPKGQAFKRALAAKWKNSVTRGPLGMSCSNLTLAPAITRHFHAAPSVRGAFTKLAFSHSRTPTCPCLLPSSSTPRAELGSLVS